MRSDAAPSAASSGASSAGVASALLTFHTNRLGSTPPPVDVSPLSSTPSHADTSPGPTRRATGGSADCGSASVAFPLAQSEACAPSVEGGQPVMPTGATSPGERSQSTSPSPTAVRRVSWIWSV